MGSSNSTDIGNVWSEIISHCVRQPNGCIEWQRGKTSAGYPVFYLLGRNHYVHRLVWIFYKGNIPDGMLVCHHCDNPSCVNFEHLFLGTDKDNADDRDKKNRQSVGSDLPQSKLGNPEVHFARQMYDNGLYNQNELAELFGVNQSTISRALNHETWKHV